MTIGQGALEWKESEILVSLYDRAGMAGEQYRKLRIRLEGLKETLGGAMQVIVVTSPMMGEGKTATAMNLAITLAQEEGRRVLLIDCDMRKPRVWSFFTEPPAFGLGDVLAGEIAAPEAVRRTSRVALDVLTLPRGADSRLDPLPVEKLKGLLRQMRDRYDFIVCDAPPVLPIADTAALVRIADGFLLVVRAEETPRHAVSRTLESVDRNRLIGFVFNAVAGREIDPYYYQYHAEPPNGGGGPPGRKKKRG